MTPLRHALSDDGFALIEPLLPDNARPGRPWKADRRVIDGTLWPSIPRPLPRPAPRHLRSLADRLRAVQSIEPLLEDLGPLDLEGIAWVIVGGESGVVARPMDERWVLSIRNQCRAAGVPFFFKQWGGVRKKRQGASLEGKTYDEMPERTDPVEPGKADRLAAINEVESLFTSTC